MSAPDGPFVAAGFGAIGRVRTVGTVLVLGLAASFGVVAPAQGQGGAGSSVQAVAERELARRNQLMEAAVQAISEGDLLREKGELESAVASYRSAVDSLPPAPQTEALLQQAQARFASASVELAEQRVAEGRFEDAEALVDVVLSPEYSPTDSKALTLKEQLQDDTFYNRALTPQHLDNVTEVKRLLLRARSLVSLGEFDEAARTYNQILSIDRFNDAARRGLEQLSRTISGQFDSSRDHLRAHMLREVDESWALQPRRGATELAAASDGGFVVDPMAQDVAGGVAAKMRGIVIPQTSFVEASLQDIVDYLSSQSRELDATSGGRRGVDIVIDPGATLDPVTGLDVRQKKISLSLTNTPLGEVLRYVADLAGLGVRIERYAVRLAPRGALAQAVIRRETFRVPPNFLSMADSGGGPAADVDAVFGAPDAGEGSNLFRRLTAVEFLSQNGVGFPEGASAQFIPLTSTLVVSNTEENLDVVRRLVDAAFEETAKQVQVELILMETSQENLEELGFDWLVGAFNVPGSDRVFGAGGTGGNQITTGGSGGSTTGAADFPFVPPGGDVPVGRNPITAGNRSGSQISELENSIDALLLRSGEGADNVVSRKAPGTLALAGVLTDPQFQVVIRSLNQKKGVDMLTAPMVVTRSGQRATMAVEREFPYPIEFDPPEIPQDFGGGLFNGQNGGAGNAFLASQLQNATPVIAATPATPTAFEVRELGATLEVEPIIGPDNKTIEISIAAEVDEFDGFIDYGSPITTGQTVITENRIIQPIFSTIRGNTQLEVWNGASVVIGGLLRQERVDTNDKTPILGDVPLAGRLFRSKVSGVRTRALVLIVRVHIIDPAGATAAGVQVAGEGGL